MTNFNISKIGKIAKAKIADWGWITIASFMIATLVPTLIFTSVAMKRPVSFDGAMNLQVAQNLAETGKYYRNYSYNNSSSQEKATNTRLFPGEVETNGPYIITAATGIKLFGQNQFGYQFSNIVFIFGVAAIIWWMLRRWIVFATLSPALVLLLIPGSFETALGGYGEIPALFFALLAIAFVSFASSLEKKSQLLKYISFAMIAAGAAITTKTYLVGFVPALLLGVLLIKFTRDLTFKSISFRTAYILLFPAIHELWHLVSLGSIGEYITWWKPQLKAILFQSGLWKTGHTTPSGQGVSVLEKVSHQLDKFVDIAGLTPFIISIISVAISIIAIRIAISNRHKINRLAQQLLKNKNTILLIMLLAMFATYFLWWLLFLPESKTFYRRTLPAMLPLEIAMALTMSLWARLFFIKHTRLPWKDTEKSIKVIITGRALFVGSLILLMSSLVNPIASVVKSYQAEPYLSMGDYQNTINSLRQFPQETKYFGSNWWSAPVIGLMGDIEIYNLENVDLCKLDDHNSVFIWDKIAIGITKMYPPRMQGVNFKLYKNTGAASLYTFSPAEDSCNKLTNN